MLDENGCLTVGLGGVADPWALTTINATAKADLENFNRKYAYLQYNTQMAAITALDTHHLIASTSYFGANNNSVTQACQIGPDPKYLLVEWLWNPYLAVGMLAMLSGDPGAGKTLIALAIAAAITLGRVPYTGQAFAPAHVLYLSTENSPPHVLRPRFDALGGRPNQFHLLRGSVTGDGERGSVRLSDVPLLSDALRQTNARFAVVDPIQSYLGADEDAHRSNETRPVMDGLSRLAEEHGCCILLVRHLGKAPTGKAIHRGLGSIDLTGAVRTELLAGCSPDDPSQRALVQVKSNLGQLGPSLGYTIEGDGKFRWTGESQLTASAILAPEQNGEETGAMAEAEAFLLNALTQGARPQKEIESEARQEGISRRTLTRAKRRLEVRSHKTSLTGAWEWLLPEGGQE